MNSEVLATAVVSVVVYIRNFKAALGRFECLLNTQTGEKFRIHPEASNDDPKEPLQKLKELIVCFERWPSSNTLVQIHNSSPSSLPLSKIQQWPSRRCIRLVQYPGMYLHIEKMVILINLASFVLISHRRSLQKISISYLVQSVKIITRSKLEFQPFTR
jgi:hypothetical protein